MLTGWLCLNAFSYPPVELSSQPSIYSVVSSLSSQSDRAGPWLCQGLSGKEMPLPNWEPLLPKVQLTKIKSGRMESAEDAMVPRASKAQRGEACGKGPASQEGQERTAQGHQVPSLAPVLPSILHQGSLLAGPMPGDKEPREVGHRTPLLGREQGGEVGSGSGLAKGATQLGGCPTEYLCPSGPEQASFKIYIPGARNILDGRGEIIVLFQPYCQAPEIKT